MEVRPLRPSRTTVLVRSNLLSSSRSARARRRAVLNSCTSSELTFTYSTCAASGQIDFGGGHMHMHVHTRPVTYTHART